jgi:2-phospho-L-lactate guanylyltransferase
MRVIVPFDAREPNTRLAPVLGDTERHEFARAMLADVLDAVRTAGHQPELLSTAPIDCEPPVTVDTRALTPAVNAALADRSRPIGVVMADLALLTAAAVDRLCRPDDGVVIAPGIGGGTNALVVRDPAFRVDYHGTSYRDHCEQARSRGTTLATVDSFRLGIDVDEPADLVEPLVHGEGRSREWLEDAGFALVESDERTIARRRDESG